MQILLSYYELFQTPSVVTEFQAQPLKHAKKCTVTTDANMQTKINNGTDLQVF